jgi:chitinase
VRRSTAWSAAAAVAVAVGATVALANTGSAAPSVTTTALSDNWYAAAPYVMPLDNDPPDLTQVMAATGQRAFQLSFILSDGGCSAAWDGSASQEVASDTTVAGVINSVRAAGGDVSVSFGGANGTKLGQVCGTPTATAAAEQAVITKYGLHAIDLDLEEPEYENTTAINNEIGAAQILQRDDPGLYISITTAGTAAGTGFFGQNVLNTAKGIGFTPNNFSIMPFDGGFSGAASQISALTAFHSLLVNTFGWDSATAFAHEGFSGMNGRTDSAEMFTQTDFQSVLSYATTNGMARFTFWSLNRDRQCSVPDNNGSLSGTCSSVPQAAWDFTRFDVQFAGATPPPPVSTQPAPPVSTTPPAGGTGSCAGVPAWNGSTAFVGGSTVTFGGHEWTAQWWTFNDTPGGAAGVWVDNGPC